MPSERREEAARQKPSEQSESKDMPACGEMMKGGRDVVMNITQQTQNRVLSVQKFGLAIKENIIFYIVQVCLQVLALL